MIEGNGYGHNWDGWYDPELVEFYGRQRREGGDRWSPTVTMTALAGRWSAEQLHPPHHAMARNLVPEGRRQDDAALADGGPPVLPPGPLVARAPPAPGG